MEVCIRVEVIFPRRVAIEFSNMAAGAASASTSGLMVYLLV